VERAEAPPWPSGNAKTIDADLENLEKFLKQRIKTYDGLASGADKSARFKRFYSDLEKTAKEDLAALKNWKSLAGWEKQMLYGQIAHEIHVELKHNVNITRGDYDWSHKEIAAIDAALSKLPPKLGLENEKLYNIRRFKDIIDPSDKSQVAGWTKASG